MHSARRVCGRNNIRHNPNKLFNTCPIKENKHHFAFSFHHNAKILLLSVRLPILRYSVHSAPESSLQHPRAGVPTPPSGLRAWDSRTPISAEERSTPPRVIQLGCHTGQVAASQCPRSRSRYERRNHNRSTFDGTSDAPRASDRQIKHALFAKWLKKNATMYCLGVYPRR